MNKALDKDLVSVIVAAYNAEPYLEGSLNSILDQTHKNLEVIVIDDGSTDGTSKIVKGYENDDVRVRLIKVENGGAARARNIAISQLKGTYFVIVDSDDTIEPTYVHDLYWAILESNADMSVCGYYFAYDDGRDKKIKFSSHKTRTVLSKAEILKDFLLEDSLMQPVFWNKLYKTATFRDNNLKIPEGEIYEDTRFLYQIYHYIDKAVYISKPLYNYLQRQGSVMNVRFSQKDIDTLRNISKEVRHWFSEKYSNQYDSDVFAFEVGINMNIVNFMVQKKDYIEHEWLISSNYLRSHFFRIIGANNISAKRKIGCLFVLTGFKNYTLIRKVL